MGISRSKILLCAESYRNPRVTKYTCVLCGEKTICFAFSDNEGYGCEAICEECLEEALKVLRFEIDEKV